jgi:hypothetical protein
VNADARRAIAVIRRCVESGRYAISDHFAIRLEQRGLFWPDVQAVIDIPKHVRSQGRDDYDRPKWLIRGVAANDADISIVCAIEVDESETEFITLFWED